MTVEKVITIHPITRLEGHGKISIFLDDNGNVDDAYFQTVEFRGFEKFCMGRPVEEMPYLTPRICGVCPWAHHMASAKAADDVYKVDIPATAKKLRELAYNAFYVHDHGAVFYALSAPDFVVGPTAPKAERNIMGVLDKVGVDVGKTVLQLRSEAKRILETLGGRAVHPTMAVVGGVSSRIDEEKRASIEESSKKLVRLGELTLDLFEKAVLGNKEYVEIITGDTYLSNTYYMGLVDDQDKVNFYDGRIKVVDPRGREFVTFDSEDYLQHIRERAEPWTYLKFPYLKKVGWKGFRDGEESGVYRVGPLARLNVADGFTTPKAQEAYKKFVSTLGKPVHATLGYHWARVIEILAAGERALELSQDPEVTGEEFRRIPEETPSEGVGVIEAPRGTLIHHYKTDDKGMLTMVNLIVATTHNNAGICLSVKGAAKKVIKNWNVDDGILNQIEMAFRAYDPCLACGTHSLPGTMPMEINIYTKEGELYQTIRR